MGALLAVVDIASIATDASVLSLDAMSRLRGVVEAVALVGGIGAWVGTALAVVERLRQRAEATGRMPWVRLRSVGALYLGGVIGSMIFVYGFSFLPQFGIAVVGAQGVLEPITAGFAGLGVAAMIGGLASGWLLWRVGQRRYVYGTISSTVLLVLFYVVSVVLYEGARLAPMNFVHALCFIVLVAHATAFTVWLLGARLACLSRRTMIGVAAVSLSLPVFISPSLVRRARQDIRLLLRERTEIVYQSLRIEEPMISTTGKPWDWDGCSAKPAAPPSIDVSPSEGSAVQGVVVIVIDALRFDALSAKRNGHHVAPELNTFAERHQAFHNAYATAPSTSTSVQSMLSGRYVQASNAPALSGILGRQGIQTLAIPTHPQVGKHVGEFDVIVNGAPKGTDLRLELTAHKVTETAKTQLDRIPVGRRFFAFIHYYDPHEYYISNPLYDYGSGRDDKYWAEVSYTDRFVGELLSHLRERSDYDKIAVIILSDHGDELWDHGYVAHGLRLYDESVGVVFLLRDPRMTKARAAAYVQGAVSGIDVAPTVLELFGLPVPSTMEGIPLGRQRRTVQSPVFFEAPSRVGAATADRKVIYDHETQLLEVYNLANDPREQVNLVAEETFPSLLCALQRRFF